MTLDEKIAGLKRFANIPDDSKLFLSEDPKINALSNPIILHYIYIAKRDVAIEAMDVVNELQAENEKLKERLETIKNGLSNVRFMLRNPRTTIFELTGQVESADLMAKRTLEFYNNQNNNE